MHVREQGSISTHRSLSHTHNSHSLRENKDPIFQLCTVLQMTMLLCDNKTKHSPFAFQQEPYLINPKPLFHFPACQNERLLETNMEAWLLQTRVLERMVSSI